MMLRIRITRNRMKDLLEILIIIAAWLFLQRWLLPKLGVPT